MKRQPRKKNKIYGGFLAFLLISTRQKALYLRGLRLKFKFKKKFLKRHLKMKLRIRKLARRFGVNNQKVKLKKI